MTGESTQVARIGARVRAARARRGWNRKTLATEAGLSPAGVAQIESGRRRNLRVATLTGLARALAVNVDYLVGGRPSQPMLEHHALVYESDVALLEAAGPFLRQGVDHGEATLAVTTPENIALLRDWLGAAAKQIAFIDSSKWYREPATTMRAYREFAARKLDEGAPWVRVLGEPVWSEAATSRVQAWACYESLINLELANFPLTVLCPYDERALDPTIVREARRTHPHTATAEARAASPHYVEPGAFLLDER